MIRKLTIFKEVAETVNITMAAQRLHMSQPAVSVAIKELEIEYGCLLFERNGKRIKITEKGSWLYQQVLVLLDQITAIDQRMKGLDAFPKIRVGVSASVGSSIFAGLVLAYKKKHPQMNVLVSVDSSSAIEKKIINNECTIAFLEGISQDYRIVSQVAFKDRLHLVVPLNFEHSFISMHQLEGLPYLAREIESGTRQLVDSVLSAQGVKLSIQWESRSIEAILSAIEHGIGVSILPNHLVERALEQKRCKICIISDLSIERVVTIAYHRDKQEIELVNQWLDIIEDVLISL